MIVNDIKDFKCMHVIGLFDWYESLRLNPIQNNLKFVTYT